MHLTLFDTPVLIVWSLYKATTSRALTLVSVGHIPHNTVFWFSSHLWVNWENSLIYSDLQCIPPTVWIQKSHLIFSIHLKYIVLSVFVVMKCRTAETYLPDSVFGFLFSCFLAYPRPTSFVFVYTQQQGIPQNTAGDPSHYYTSKSGYSLPRQQHITHALAVNGPTGWYSANMQMKSPQSHGEGKKEGKERKAPPLCNKLQLRASAAGRESALEK